MKPTEWDQAYASRPVHIPRDEAAERAEEQAREIEAVASALAWCIGVTLVISVMFYWSWS